MLYLRALVGVAQYSEAIALLDKLSAKYPEEPTLVPQRRALVMLVQAQQQEKIDKKTAVTNYEGIYGTRENLIPEIGDTVGHILANLKGPDMDAAASAQQYARAADVASIVMQFSDDPTIRRHAADVLIKNLQKIPWKMDLVWRINGTPVSLSSKALYFANDKLKEPLVVQFDPNSPFLLRMTINCVTNAQAAQVAQALSSGQRVTPPAAVSQFQFLVEATHPTLGTIYKSAWKSSDVPKAGVPWAAPPPPDAAPKATPAPVDTPAPGAAPTPTPTPKAPKMNLGGGNALLAIDSMETIELFCMLKLNEYVRDWPKVTLLPSHLSVPKAQEILREQ